MVLGQKPSLQGRDDSRQHHHTCIVLSAIVPDSFGMVPSLHPTSFLQVIKNGVGCRDDTVPKTVDIRRHCEVDLRACNNLSQPQKTKM